MNYSFEMNGKIVNKYIETIADSFIERKIINHQIIEKELKSISAKKSKPKKQKSAPKQTVFSFDLNKMGF